MFNRKRKRTAPDMVTSVVSYTEATAEGLDRIARVLHASREDVIAGALAAFVDAQLDDDGADTVSESDSDMDDGADTDLDVQRALGSMQSREDDARWDRGL